MSPKTIPIGVENYQKLTNGNYLYGDKTLLIKEIITKT